MPDLFTNILSKIVDTFPNVGAKQAFVLAVEISDMVDSDREVYHPTVDFNFEYMESAQVATLRAQVAQLTSERDKATDRANAYATALCHPTTTRSPEDSIHDVMVRIRPVLVAFAAADLKIPAIRLVRDRGQCGLSEAKRLVDDEWPMLRREARPAAKNADQRR